MMIVYIVTVCLLLTICIEVPHVVVYSIENLLFMDGRLSCVLVYIMTLLHPSSHVWGLPDRIALRPSPPL